MATPKFIPLSKILKLYQEKELSMKQVAARLGVTRQTISYRLGRAGVPIRPFVLKLPDRESIERLYVEEGLGMMGVAAKLKVPVPHVQMALEHYGTVPRRHPKIPAAAKTRGRRFDHSAERDQAPASHLLRYGRKSRLPCFRPSDRCQIRPHHAESLANT